MFRQFVKNKHLFFLVMIIALLAVSCSSGDKSADDFNTENIFFDYKISAEETDDNLTILLQLKDGGPEDNAISIAGWGKLTLDGEVLPEDSTRRNGFFYETHKPITTFSGKHTILLSGGDKEEYKEEFEFQPLSLITTVADSIQRDDLVFDFTGLDSIDYVRIVLTDTSFTHEGINRVDTVENGQLIISKAELENLANGPVQLEFIREYERPIKSGTEQGGRLQITYSLKREFILKD